ncbi:MAG: hypothetical protein GY841_10570 [FCB group bacterium]|nr:hypothetical protein [FCB group bacterium]
MRIKTVMLIAVVLFLTAVGWAQDEVPTDSVVQAIPPGPPLNVQAFDTPYDNGHSINLTWELSVDDAQGQKSVLGYKVMRAEAPDGPFMERIQVGSGSTSFQDKGIKDATEENKAYLPRNHDFYYKIVAVTADSESESAITGPVQGVGQWFNAGKMPVLIAVILFTAFTLYFVWRAKKGDHLYVRPLAGIDAVDEAIGRATEMGKPILYVLGLGTAADIATIASFTILSRVAKKVAEYQTTLIVPCYDPIVMTIAQETVKGAYNAAGRPDAYSDDQVFFLTNYQFAYVGAVNGIMIREKPATNFYLGKFYAESLILAETGASTGSIQISGTDEVTQIPFFVVACDYTLIGEELYAASAYLSREPVLLGSLKAQDWGKALVIISILLGVIAASFGWENFVNMFHVGH